MVYNENDARQRIKSIIRAKGMTYVEIAKTMGTTSQYISAMLSGCRSLPADKIIEFAAMLNISVDYILFGGLSDVVVSARKCGYERINGICDKDSLVLSNVATESENLSEKIVLVETKEKMPFLCRIKTAEETAILYFDNGEPPIIVTEYNVIGVIKKIVRDM